MATEFSKNIAPRDIVREMEESYIDYAMSVIVQRALPDVRDGLKPVHRRILYAMREMGLTPGARMRKSAAVVGDVLGKYHPHGDQAVYDSLTRMAQDFSLRYPLVVGQGNFGSVDGDLPAAMRYTEVKLSPVADFVLQDIDKDTVAFLPNYDGTREEPRVLPTVVPNLLVNGSVGIAVGMATAIPPHNLGEVVDALVHVATHPNAGVQDLVQFVRGPDFPTGGIIFGAQDILTVYGQGRGPVLVRGKAEVAETNRGRKQIVITEIPYEVRKSALLEQIALLVQEKKIEGIRDVRDESDKDGLRVVIDLKEHGQPFRVLQALYKFTDFERRYHVNMLALINEGLQPKVLTLKEALSEFLEFRREVITRRSKFELEKSKQRLHILEGLVKALDTIGEIIVAIRASRSKEAAHEALRKKFTLSDAQASAILALPLSSLARLEREKIIDERKALSGRIRELTTILGDPKVLRAVLVGELKELRDKFADPRRTEIRAETPEAVRLEDTIPEAQVVVVLTSDGYVKRMAPDSFRVQKRGGRGVIGVGVREEEAVRQLVMAHTKAFMLFFSNRGRVFRVPVYEIPEAPRAARGRSLANFLDLPQGERIASLVSFGDTPVGFLTMVTARGIIKRVPVEAFQNVRRFGIQALKFKGDDELVSVAHSDGQKDIFLCTSFGKALRFMEKELRPMGRQASGVRGMRLSKEDKVMALLLLSSGITPKGAPVSKEELLLVTTLGFGKRVGAGAFRRQRHGGSGVRAMSTGVRAGHVAGASFIHATAEEILAVSERGLTLRMKLKDVKALSRTAQGVRVMRLEANDRIASFTVL